MQAASLIAACIPLAAGSDAPYAQVDPWLAMRTARDRRIASGQSLAVCEAIGARAAQGLYLADGLTAGLSNRALAAGAAADVVLCRGTLADVLEDLTADRVAGTFVAGRVAFLND